MLQCKMNFYFNIIINFTYVQTKKTTLVCSHPCSLNKYKTFPFHITKSLKNSSSQVLEVTHIIVVSRPIWLVINWMIHVMWVDIGQLLMILLCDMVGHLLKITHPKRREWRPFWMTGLKPKTPTLGVRRLDFRAFRV